jgi:hypothetical protein
VATPKAVTIELSGAEAAELASRLRRRKVARADAMRAEIVLLAAEGVSNVAIAERLGTTRVTVATWRQRFAESRLDGLLDEPRPGAPRTVTDQKVADVVTATLETLPVGRTHWSSRGMARASRLAPSTVQRIWKAFPLQPHRSETFKLSTDPLFVESGRQLLARTKGHSALVARPAHDRRNSILAVGLKLGKLAVVDYYSLTSQMKALAPARAIGRPPRELDLLAVPVVTEGRGGIMSLIGGLTPPGASRGQAHLLTVPLPGTAGAATRVASGHSGNKRRRRRTSESIESCFMWL